MFKLRNYLLFSLLFIFNIIFLAFADESLTITTYYPSPYGSYNELRANKMVVDSDPSATAAPSFTGGLTFRGIGSDPIAPSTFARGTMYYNTTSNVFKYSPNGSTWQVIGGGVSYTYYCFNDVSKGPVCTDAGGSQRYCPPGYTQKLALGLWGSCRYYSGGDIFYFRPPGEGCGSSTSFSFGSAYVCSQ